MKFVHEPIDLGYNDLTAQSLNNSRIYNTPDGDYPSVTTVLSILSEAAIQEWRKRVGEEEANRISGRASSRGTKVHSIIEDYLNGKDTTEYLPHIRQSLSNLKPILDTRIGRIFGLEVPLYSRHLGLAGRCDAVAEFDGVVSIIDWKTSRYPKKKSQISNYFCQMAAYAIMFEERTGLPVTNLAVVMDCDGFDYTHEPLVFKEHRDNWTEMLIDTIKEYKRRKLFS